MDNNCTLVINSCDAYSDLWDIFFRLFKIQWMDCPYPIILNTESKDYTADGLNLRCLHFFKQGEKVTWSKLTKTVLEKINTDYVIFLLDDFFLESVVLQDKIDECISWMNENKNIATFSFMPAPQPNIISKKYNGFELRGSKSPYRFNCQAGIWRRKLLIKYLRDHESAWQFETWGSIRSRRYKEEFYSLCEREPLVFDYAWGNPIKRGKWYEPEVLKLENQFGIKFDWEKRGFYDNGYTINTNRKSIICKAAGVIKSLI